MAASFFRQLYSVENPSCLLSLLKGSFPVLPWSLLQEASRAVEDAEIYRVVFGMKGSKSSGPNGI